MANVIDTNREYISISQASERSGLSNVYLAQLLRKGTLEGVQIVRDWIIYTDSLEKFLATPRKSGPKGPRKKSSSSNGHNVSTAASDNKKS